MKHVTLLLVLLLLVLSACTSEQLPPEPNAPGSVGNYYRAIGDWATFPDNFFVETPEDIVCLPGETVTLSYSAEDNFIYQNMYIWDNSIQDFSLVQFNPDARTYNLKARQQKKASNPDSAEVTSEDLLAGSWVKGNALSQISYDCGDLVSMTENGALYAVAYSCTKQKGSWDCNDNKWQVQVINVTLDSPAISNPILQPEPTPTVPIQEELIAVASVAPEVIEVVYAESSQVTTENFCLDSDGRDFFTKGTISTQHAVFSERCLDNTTLVEFQCSAQDTMSTTSFTCVDGCFDGACIIGNTTTQAIESNYSTFSYFGKLLQWTEFINTAQEGPKLVKVSGESGFNAGARGADFLSPSEYRRVLFPVESASDHYFIGLSYDSSQGNIRNMDFAVKLEPTKVEVLDKGSVIKSLQRDVSKGDMFIFELFQGTVKIFEKHSENASEELLHEYSDVVTQPLYPDANLFFVGNYVPAAYILGVPFSGECGSEINTCTVGDYIDQVDSSSEHLWSCVGINLGGVDYCSAEKVVTPVDLSSPIIERLTFYNAQTDNPVLELVDGAIINKDELGILQYSVNVIPNDLTESVLFEYNDGSSITTRTENVAPYALFGDNVGGDFVGKPLTEGQHTLTVTPFSQDNMGGTAGQSKTITFEVIGFSQAPINGVCGDVTQTRVVAKPFSDLCTQGSASFVSGNEFTDSYDWTCQGEFGGNSVSCQASCIDGYDVVDQVYVENYCSTPCTGNIPSGVIINDKIGGYALSGSDSNWTWIGEYDQFYFIEGTSVLGACEFACPQGLKFNGEECSTFPGEPARP